MGHSIKYQRRCAGSTAQWWAVAVTALLPSLHPGPFQSTNTNLSCADFGFMLLDKPFIYLCSHNCSILFFFFTLSFFKFYDFCFFIIVDLQCSVNFYCITKWPSDTYMYVYILFLTLSFIVFHHRWLDIVPCAIQQDLIAYLLQRQ